MSEYKYKSLVFDGSTQFMNIHLLGELQDEYFKSREFKDKKHMREIAVQTETDWTIFNAMAFQMLRVFKMMRMIAGNSNYFIHALWKYRGRQDGFCRWQAALSLYCILMQRIDRFPWLWKQ